MSNKNRYKEKSKLIEYIYLWHFEYIHSQDMLNLIIYFNSI